MKPIKRVGLISQYWPEAKKLAGPPVVSGLSEASVAGELPPAASRRGGYTIIEFIGVLAIMAILVSMLIPVVLNDLDAAAVTAETANLTTIQNALVFEITHNFEIPGTNEWAPILANSLMIPTGSVTRNARGYNRAYVWDTGGFAGLSLPYFQTNGLAAVPGDPRLMIISSISTNVPIGSGGMDSNDFTAIWNTLPGNIPSSWNTSSNVWNGNAGDLIIQRVNLQPLFCRVVLNAIDTNDFGSVTIQSGLNTSYFMCILTNSLNTTNALATVWNLAGGLLSTLGAATLTGPAPTSQVPQAFTAWYIQGTVLNLYDTNNGVFYPNLESQAVVQSDCSYVFEDEAWRGLLCGWGTNGPIIGVAGTSTNSVNSWICTKTEKVFKTCPLNNNDYNNNGYGNHGDSCTALSGCCQTFMQDYSSWCDEGFGNGSDNSCTRLVNDCNAVQTITQNMCQ
jgi:hypothetical protein